MAYPSLKAITDINVSHITTFKRFCVEGLENTFPTTNKKLKAIRNFFDFLRDINHIIKHNVALEVSYFDEDIENQPLHIPGSKLKLLIDIIYGFKYGVRDVCITKLIALMALRIGEIFDLSYKSDSLQAKEIYLKRDTDTITFPIPDLLYVDLKYYIVIRTDIVDETKSSDNKLFLSNPSNQYPTRSYQKKFKTTVIEEDRLKIIMNQDKVDKYYMG